MLVCGHRGSPSNSPENTLASFKIAIDAGVDMLEFDIHKCKSGELVVIHDDDVARTTGGIGLVCDLTYAELQKFDAGNGELIPILAEVIELCEKHDIIALIEIKAADAAIPVANFITKRISESKNTYANLIAISLYTEILSDIKSTDSNIKIGITFKNSTFDIVENVIEKMQPYSINPHINCATLEMVDLARSHGIKVFNWTVNSNTQYKKARALGVDAVMSDNPKMMVGLVRNGAR